MTIRRINFHSIPVDDQDRAVDFYTGKLGFERHTDAPYGEGWRWIFLTLPGAETRLHFARREEIGADPEKPVLSLVCDDVDAEAARLSAAGVTVAGGPGDAPWAPRVRWATIKDSEGNIVLLESLKEG